MAPWSWSPRSWREPYGCTSARPTPATSYKLASIIKDDLKANIRSIPTADYLKAKKFLTSLEFEMPPAGFMPTMRPVWK